jgi:hypothetical protein
LFGRRRRFSQAFSILIPGEPVLTSREFLGIDAGGAKQETFLCSRDSHICHPTFLFELGRFLSTRVRHPIERPKNANYGKLPALSLMDAGQKDSPARSSDLVRNIILTDCVVLVVATLGDPLLNRVDALKLRDKPVEDVVRELRRHLTHGSRFALKRGSKLKRLENPCRRPGRCVPH